MIPVVSETGIFNCYIEVVGPDEYKTQAIYHRSPVRYDRRAIYLDRLAVWFYPDPKAAAKEIKGTIAFWKGGKLSSELEQTSLNTMAG